MFTAIVKISAMYPVIDPVYVTQTIIIENLPTDDLSYLQFRIDCLEDLEVSRPFYIKSVTFEEK
jgi:hypothetical protein